MIRSEVSIRHQQYDCDGLVLFFGVIFLFFVDSASRSDLIAQGMKLSIPNFHSQPSWMPLGGKKNFFHLDRSAQIQLCSTGQVFRLDGHGPSVFIFCFEMMLEIFDCLLLTNIQGVQS
jgi:hypothetical protein